MRSQVRALSPRHSRVKDGEVAKRSKALVCKTSAAHAPSSVRIRSSPPLVSRPHWKAVNPPACHAGDREFEPRWGRHLFMCGLGLAVEHHGATVDQASSTLAARPRLSSPLVAKSVDAPDSGSGAFGCAGSRPAEGTSNRRDDPKGVDVAQLAELRVVGPMVVGSSPTVHPLGVAPNGRFRVGIAQR